MKRKPIKLWSPIRARKYTFMSVAIALRWIVSQPFVNKEINQLANDKQINENQLKRRSS